MHSEVKFIPLLTLSDFIHWLYQSSQCTKNCGITSCKPTHLSLLRQEYFVVLSSAVGKKNMHLAYWFVK
jgi:hypothetical protein